MLIYCTCTLSVEENELVVQHALESRDVMLVDTGLPFGKPGFVKYEKYRLHPKMAMCRRFYPHVHNTDGFFVAKLVKRSNDIPAAAREADVREAEAKKAKEEKSRKKQREKNHRKQIRLAAQGMQQTRKQKRDDK